MILVLRVGSTYTILVENVSTILTTHMITTILQIEQLVAGTVMLMAPTYGIKYILGNQLIENHFLNNPGVTIYKVNDPNYPRVFYPVQEVAYTTAWGATTYVDRRNNDHRVAVARTETGYHIGVVN